MNINEAVNMQRDFFNDDKTKSVSMRLNCLKSLASAVNKYEEEVMEALYEDLGKCQEESYLTEIAMVKNELKYVIKNLTKWVKPQKVKTPLMHFPAKSYICPSPYGTVLVLVPWNYPFQLCLMPVIGALAAGNTVIIKLSEASQSINKVVNKLFNECLPKELVYCLQEPDGSYEEILAERYDYIFFTGSERVGKIVMKAGAEHLTPVTLELGGKSPCIVDGSGDIALFAKRIVWGKFTNCGQTCVAPDYILVNKSVKAKLIEELKANIKLMYGDNPLANSSYSKIINLARFKEMQGLIEAEPNKIGGNFNEKSLKIEPTIFHQANFSSPIMAKEIFGPILPIIEYNNLGQVIAKLKTMPKPLALYLFTANKEVEKMVINSLNFGGGCINDTIVHLANHYLPFGGVGTAGTGSYHGKFSFKTFSHQKSLMKRYLRPDFAIRYQPYDPSDLKKMKKLF